jgi:hypothetical protein
MSNELSALIKISGWALVTDAGSLAYRFGSLTKKYFNYYFTSLFI